MRRGAALRVQRDDRGDVAANTAVFGAVILLLFVSLQFGFPGTNVFFRRTRSAMA